MPSREKKHLVRSSKYSTHEEEQNHFDFAPFNDKYLSKIFELIASKVVSKEELDFVEQQQIQFGH